MILLNSLPPVRSSVTITATDLSYLEVGWLTLPILRHAVHSMQRTAFLELVRSKQSQALADQFLRSAVVAAFSSEELYDQFKVEVSAQLRNAEHVVVAGTANWTFSLNPNKDFRRYNSQSDVDTVVISEDHFMQTWEQLRVFHRQRYTYLSVDGRRRLRRKGENVYSGFVSPLWIPDDRNRFRWDHQRALNKLSDAAVDYRRVTMLFFRNWTEAVDYYKRGFQIAKGRLRT